MTKRATATIDLKKAIAVEDDQDVRNNAMSPASRMSGRSGSRCADEYDGLYGVERSFRLIFPADQEILFFADTDEEKTKWCVFSFAIASRCSFLFSKAGSFARSCWSYTSPSVMGRIIVAAAG